MRARVRLTVRGEAEGEGEAEAEAEGEGEGRGQGQAASLVCVGACHGGERPWCAAETVAADGSTMGARWEHDGFT